MTIPTVPAPDAFAWAAYRWLSAKRTPTFHAPVGEVSHCIHFSTSSGFVDAYTACHSTSPLGLQRQLHPAPQSHSPGPLPQRGIHVVFTNPACAFACFAGLVCHVVHHQNARVPSLNILWCIEVYCRHAPPLCRYPLAVSGTARRSPRRMRRAFPAEARGRPQSTGSPCRKLCTKRLSSSATLNTAFQIARKSPSAPTAPHAVRCQITCWSKRTPSRRQWFRLAWSLGALCCCVRRGRELYPDTFAQQNNLLHIQREAAPR